MLRRRGAGRDQARFAEVMPWLGGRGVLASEWGRACGVERGASEPWGGVADEPFEELGRVCV